MDGDDLRLPPPAASAPVETAGSRGGVGEEGGRRKSRGGKRWRRVKRERRSPADRKNSLRWDPPQECYQCGEETRIVPVSFCLSEMGESNGSLVKSKTERTPRSMGHPVDPRRFFGAGSPGRAQRR